MPRLVWQCGIMEGSDLRSYGFTGAPASASGIAESPAVSSHRLSLSEMSRALPSQSADIHAIPVSADDEAMHASSSQAAGDCSSR